MEIIGVDRKIRVPKREFLVEFTNYLARKGIRNECGTIKKMSQVAKAEIENVAQEYVEEEGGDGEYREDKSSDNFVSGS